MSVAATTLDFAPLIPVWAIGSLSAFALVITGVGAIRRLNGWLWRSLSVLLISAVLMNPCPISRWPSLTARIPWIFPAAVKRPMPLLPI
jgi:hypothetical protein